jgi:pimeloyl-ACP methyl ester carboxylesterase
MTLLDQRPACPVAIVHGVDDDVVPVSLSRGFVDRHPWVELHELAGAGHFEVIADSGPGFELVHHVLTAEPTDIPK